MFRVLRYCRICLAAGMIGMLAGMAGQIYIYEFSDRNDVLMQAGGHRLYGLGRAFVPGGICCCSSVPVFLCCVGVPAVEPTEEAE